MANARTSRKSPRKAGTAATARIRSDVHQLRRGVRETGRNLQDLGQRLLVDAASAAFDKVEQTLVAAQRRIDKARAQLRAPRA